MIHPSAIVSPDAQIDPTAEIGPYAIIEGPVVIGPKCRVLPHAQIIGDTQVEEGSSIGRGAIIGEYPQDVSFSPNIKSGVRIGKNNLIREHVTIHRSAKDGGLTRIGDNNFLMVGVHLGHDVQVGDRCIIANAALVAGHVHIGNNTFIGGGAVFHQFVRLGDYCVVQGNGSFSKDIPHFCAAQRINRVTGLNVIGLRRQGFNTQDRAAVKEAFDLVFREGLNLSQALAKADERTWPTAAQRFLDFLKAPSKKGVCQMRPGKGNDGVE